MKHALRQVIYLKCYFLTLSDIDITQEKHVNFGMLLSHHLEINSTLSMVVKGKQTNVKILTIPACKRG